MPLRLSYQADTRVPVEVEGILPETTRDKSLAEIERMTLFHGNRRLPLAEFFRVGGSADDERIEFEGNLSGVHWIGAQLASGSIHVAGPAGRHVGSEMTGGEIVVEGDAGDWVGGEMHGGLIHIRGQAGHLIGSAYRGSPRGMTGGVILVDGAIGNECGHSMRRGLLVAGGDCGDFVGLNLIAGTIIVGGACGIRPAPGMRRGTVVLMSEAPPLLNTFRLAGPCRPSFLPLYLREIGKLGFDVPADWFTPEFLLYSGDLVTIGRGEILVRQPA